MAETYPSARAVAWICTDPSLFAAAKAALHHDIKDEQATPKLQAASSGYIGNSIVVIRLLRPPIQAGSVHAIVQEVASTLQGARSTRRRN